MGIQYCAVDISISNTGIAILESLPDDEFRLVDKTSLSTGKTKFPSRFEKKLAILELFEFYMKDKVEDLSFFVLENYSYGSKGSIADLAELNGLIKRYIYKHSKPIDVIAPSTVKKQVAGSGRASKEEVAEALKNYIVNLDDFKFNNTDETDACAIGIAYAKVMLSHID